MADRKRDMQKQSQWSNAYAKKAYDRIGAFVPKGEREKWKEYAKTKDMTLNKLICVSVDEFMERN